MIPFFQPKNSAKVITTVILLESARRNRPGFAAGGRHIGP
jgi:hypothetical protein